MGRYLLMIFAALAVSAAVCSALPVDISLKTAQCRAHCLQKFEDQLSKQDDASCHQDKDCFTCWETCDLLASNFPIWGTVCNQADLCSAGCQASCEWDSSHKSAVVPLSPHNSRLTLAFSGSKAQWTLTWAKDAAEEHVVFALFTRTQGKSWSLRHQTSDLGTKLDDLSTGSEMKLVAVAESGVLSAIITPYAPLTHVGTFVKTFDVEQETKDSLEVEHSNEIDIDTDQIWPLMYEAQVEDSGFVTTRVWWAPQSNKAGDYLVTWDVEGGGLKGHLYTDIPEVDLSLWPDTIYHVQVELMSGPLGQTQKSSELTLDTNSIILDLYSKAHQATEESIISVITKEPPRPLKHSYVTPLQVEIMLGAGAGVVAALIILALALWHRKRKSSVITYESPAVSAAKWGGWNRTLSDLTLNETLDIKSHKLSGCEPVYSTPIGLRTPPVFTVPSPPPRSSLFNQPRLHQPSVNLYSIVPPLPPPPRQISNI
ncbi:unnamed protein product [Meganyctiphanes norvegica]|uniref:Transmembrane protein fend n=1 Tax=Meganyctiphanes norvegica TaxID=48144 RepID=A0AAV2Q6J2_MEGNR